jgi:capsule polysaccharide export protein KpsE/RkpR
MMQARLQINRFPMLLAVILFALTAAAVLGGALGYTLRNSTAGSATSQGAVHNASTGSNANTNTWGTSHKPN